MLVQLGDAECLQYTAREMEDVAVGIKTRGSGTGQEEDRVSHMIFADN